MISHCLGGRGCGFAVRYPIGELCERGGVPMQAGEYVEAGELLLISFYWSLSLTLTVSGAAAEDRPLCTADDWSEQYFPRIEPEQAGFAAYSNA